MSSDVEELACEWRIIARARPKADEEHQDIDAWVLMIIKVCLLMALNRPLKLTNKQWLNKASELMSSTASDYDVSKLVTGQVVAATGLLLASIAVAPTIANSIRNSAPFILITLLYGTMMFASSYVEEEHHFWYWAATAWLMLLWVKGYAISNKLGGID